MRKNKAEAIFFFTFFNKRQFVFLTMFSKDVTESDSVRHTKFYNIQTDAAVSSRTRQFVKAIARFPSKATLSFSPVLVVAVFLLASWDVLSAAALSAAVLSATVFSAAALSDFATTLFGSSWLTGFSSALITNKLGT